MRFYGHTGLLSQIECGRLRPGLGAEHGLGYLINDGRNFFLVPQMLGAAVVLGLLGWAGSALVRLLGRRYTRGQQTA